MKIFRSFMSILSNCALLKKDVYIFGNKIHKLKATFLIFRQTPTWPRPHPKNKLLWTFSSLVFRWLNVSGWISRKPKIPEEQTSLAVNKNLCCTWQKTHCSCLYVVYSLNKNNIFLNVVFWSKKVTITYTVLMHTCSRWSKNVTSTCGSANV